MGVEESGGEWRGVEGSGGEWRRVEDRECKINLMDTCKMCDGQLPLSSGVYDHTHTPLPLSVRTRRQ